MTTQPARSAYATTQADTRPPEGVLIAARLARTLGLPRLVMIGVPVDATAIEGLPCVAAAVVPPPETGLPVIDAGLILDGSDDDLAALCRSAPAVVVLDLNGELGNDWLAALHVRADAAGVTVAHSELVRAPNMILREAPLLVLAESAAAPVCALVSAGVRGFALDPQVDFSTAPTTPLRICVASYEVVGPTHNGGIGTANTSLAHALGRAGHDVTLLFTGSVDADAEDVARWRALHAEHNVALQTLPTDSAAHRTVEIPHFNARRAYMLYEWLRARDAEHPFDVLHFPECQGHGYYVTLAKRARVAFQQMLIVAGAHSSTRWCAEANREPLRSIDALVDEHMERRSVALADVLVSPSAYMIDYMLERGWSLPERRFVQQYVLPASTRTARPRRPHPVRELVFFGRMETRKGLVTFCDALDRLAADTPQLPLSVTFLGRPEHIGGTPSVEYVAARAERWPWPHRILGEMPRADALAYLRRPSCLAVMPSTIDNSPNTVSEAIGLGIPIITSRSGGTGELLHPLDVPACTFAGASVAGGLPPASADQAPSDGDAAGLADRIRAAVEHPVCAPRFAVDHEVNEATHVRWHEAAVAALRTDEVPGPGPTPTDDHPTVSVVVIHPSDDAQLLATLRSLSGEAQMLADVVVLDDADTTPDGAERAVALQIMRDHGWRLSSSRETHGPPMPRVVRQTQGELLVLIRSGTRLIPGFTETVRSRAATSDADILTWAGRDLSDAQQADASDTGPRVLAPLDGPALLGLLYPAFAPGGLAVRRRCVTALGGFADDLPAADAPDELLNRALLAAHPVMSIPDPLVDLVPQDVWHPFRTSGSIDHTPPHETREVRLIRTRAYRRPSSPEVADLPSLYEGLVRRAAEDRGELNGLIAYHSNERHRQAEYVAYLEGEHHRLSAEIHRLQAEIAAAPSPRDRIASVTRRLGGAHR